MSNSTEAIPLLDVDSLRPRLAQTITSISLLTDQLLYTLDQSLSSSSTQLPTTQNPGILPFQELINRYSLLVTHLNQIMMVLSSQGELERERDNNHKEPSTGIGRKRKKDELKDLKREKWDRVVVVPKVPVEESKDWLVGLLLRTKQTPQVEERQKYLSTTIPSTSTPTITSNENDNITSTTTTTKEEFSRLVLQQQKLVDEAYDRVVALKEFSNDGEEWDWKGRIGLDDEEEEREGDDETTMDVDNGGGGGGEGKKEEKKKGWTEDQVTTYLRTGKKPS